MHCTLIVSDTHFQPLLRSDDGKILAESGHDPKALSLLFQVIQDRQIDNIIHIGDICEMATISRWSAAEGRESQVRGTNGEWYGSMWRDQMAMVKVFWSYLHRLFPLATKHQLEGNHDFWSDVSFSRPPLSQFPELAFRNWSIWKDYGIKLYPYDGSKSSDQPWVDVGKYRVLHGYAGGNINRLLQKHDNVIYGHTHKVETKYARGNSRESVPRVARSIGCLSQLSPLYNSKGGAQNGYSHAFAFINTAETGQQNVEVVQIDDYCIPYYNGKTYYAKSLEQIDLTLGIFDKEAGDPTFRVVNLDNE